jgi:hypothetical protein
MHIHPQYVYDSVSEDTSSCLRLQERLLLQLQTALLGWEADAAGEAAKAAALARFGQLLQVDFSLSVQLINQVAEQLRPEERRHIINTVLQTDILITRPDKLEQLVGLLSAQQPSIFRAAAGQGQRAAVLNPLLACLHLQYVVQSLLQRASTGYAMHYAAADAGAAQLRVLQMLGADLDLVVVFEQDGRPVHTTPIALACWLEAGVSDSGLATGQQEQQGVEGKADMLTGDSGEAYVLEEGNYTELVQRRLGVVKLLVETGASLILRATGGTRSALSAAAVSGLYPVVEYLLPPTLAALGDQSGMHPIKREVSQAIMDAARGSNVRCLRLLLAAAAGGPASEEANAALCHMAGALAHSDDDLAGLKLLLAEGVPVNGRLLGTTAPLHALMCRPSNAYGNLVGGALEHMSGGH